MRISQQGLIIKETNVGEGDKILTILTPEFGKIQAMAKGARSFKSKFIAGCQLFCYTNFEFSKRKDWFMVTYAEPVETFYDLRSSLEKLSLATYFCDLLCEVATDEQDAPQIIRLALNTFHMLIKSDNLRQIKAVFELRLMAETGFAPELSACSNCESREDIISFSIHEGVVLCKNCANGVNILNGTLLALRHITEAEPRKIFSFEVTEDVAFQLASMCENYTLSHIGRDFRSLKYYHSISTNSFDKL